MFFIFFYVDLRFKLVLHMNIWWTTKNMWRTIKNIQTYSREFKYLLLYFNPKFSSWQHKKQVRERDHTFMQYPYGEGENSW